MPLGKGFKSLKVGMTQALDAVFPYPVEAPNTTIYPWRITA